MLPKLHNVVSIKCDFDQLQIHNKKEYLFKSKCIEGSMNLIVMRYKVHKKYRKVAILKLFLSHCYKFQKKTSFS